MRRLSELGVRDGDVIALREDIDHFVAGTQFTAVGDLASPRFEFIGVMPDGWVLSKKAYGDPRAAKVDKLVNDGQMVARYVSSAEASPKI